MRVDLGHLILASAALALLPGGSRLASASPIITGQLFVADYGKSVLDRYQYTFDVGIGAITSITPNGIGGNTTNAYFLGSSTSPIKEGVQGTTNDLIVVVGPHGSTQTTLQRFTQDGSYIGTIPVNFTPFNGGNIGIGNVAITADGKYEYAPLETANAIVKIDLKTGNIVASFGFSGAHDVAIAANGDVYAADYAAGGAKIIRLDSNLIYKQDLVTSIPTGVVASFRPSGLTVAPDGSLYAQNNDNTLNGNDSVFHYTFSNSGGTLTANFDSTKSYIGSASNKALQFTFGNNLGPDGNLYIAALGGGGSGSFNIQSGYIDGIYKFDTSTAGVSQFIAGYTEKTGPASASGLSAPKYLQFDTNFVNAPDAGVPEPGTTALLLAGFAGLGVLKRAWRHNG
ncbi:MAG TPA: PEP-CTERM sorting domain-containing protein [Bryobacteraceae bacterium]|jgi:hypothetical protein|nr:PEP-CTERM sorting domain-containing protein [Bryobacteraceae bacterium]